MLILKEKLEKIKEIIDEIHTNSPSSQENKDQVLGYLDAWIDDLPDEDKKS